MNGNAKRYEAVSGNFALINAPNRWQQVIHGIFLTPAAAANDWVTVFAPVRRIGTAASRAARS